MGETLFLAHRVPFPPDRGDKIRSHHLLLGLAMQGPVHVACFAETDSDRQQEAALSQVAASHILRDRATSLARTGLVSLARGVPVSLAAFADRTLARWVRRILAERPIDTIFVFSGQMGQYVPPSFEGRLIVDLCDVDSAKFGAYANEASWPRSALFRREERMLRAVEAGLARQADATLLVTEDERSLFLDRMQGGGGSGARVEVLGNGIDADFFDPALCAGEPTIAARPGPHIVFTGQMDYPPNVAAALRGIEQLLPVLRRHYPQAEWHIVGRAPTARLRAFDGRDGVQVWGEVADIRPFLLAADVVCAPLEIARGVQNKVLEAMAMCRAVVVSAEAARGIAAEDGTHWRVAADDTQMIAAILALVEDPVAARRMGRMARDFVLRELSWDSAHRRLRHLITPAGEHADAT